MHQRTTTVHPGCGYSEVDRILALAGLAFCQGTLVKFLCNCCNFSAINWADMKDTSSGEDVPSSDSSDVFED